VRHLGRIHGPRSLTNLYPLLVDGYPQVRLGAALAIGDLAQSESIPRLQAALNDGLIDVRRAVVQALSRIRDKAVVDVVAFLVSDPDDAIRTSAMEALVQVHHSSALPSLRIGLSDRKEAIRFIAFRGMMKIAPDAAVEEWPRLLNWLSATQMTALVREFGKPMLPLIERALGHSRAPVRQAALAATVAFDKIDRLGLLAGLVRSTEFGDVRLQALRMVIDEQGPAAVALLLDLARDPDLAVRRAAVEALGAAGHAAAQAGDVAATDVITALQAALMDGDEGVRIGAAASILQVAGR